MKRMGDSGRSSSASLAARDMSYTNLAAMAEQFGTYQRMLPAGGPKAEDSTASYAQAMELINTGLRLDANTPVEAISYYQRGGDILSRVLESAPPDEESDKMQRTLDMIEERVRFISRTIMGGSITDSQMASALPPTPREPDLEEDEYLGLMPSDERAFNLFDVADKDHLPRELRMALASFGTIFQELTRAFGFQHESVLNQQEHLMLLLANSARDADGMRVLHRKMTANYRKWAAHMKVPPQCAGDSDIAQNKATDLALWMLIWGEAANLRHMPECLCFLFHSMRMELWEKPLHAPRRRPQGWFLSRVVAPLYRKLRAEFKRTAPNGKPLGHTRKANYDDFNEFFWRPEALGYSYHASEDAAPGDIGVRGAAAGAAMLSSSGVAAVSEVFGASGLELGVTSQPDISSFPVLKRYMERRSWLTPIRAFWRIHSFLIVALHICIVLAFARNKQGVVLDGALLQLLLGALITSAICNAIFELLGGYTQFGMLHNHLGQFGSLSLRFVVKVALAAALTIEYGKLLDDAPLALQHVPPSVWTRTVLLRHSRFCAAAAAYAIPSALSLLANIVPCLSTWARSWTGPAKWVLDVLEPLNRLYVGKDIHVAGVAPKLAYSFFWLSLIMFKLGFSYFFQIQPLVEPTTDTWSLDLSDWWPSVRLGKIPNMLVIFVNWAPVVLMYMLDLQIWFMLWQAFYGTMLGWTLHIGEVPDFDTLRERFLDASEAFNTKLLSKDTPLIVVSEPPYAPPNAAAMSPSSAPTGSFGVSKSGKKAGPLDDLKVSLLEAASAPGSAESPGGALRNESLRYFSETWNAIVGDLRVADLISNRELALMSFSTWANGGGNAAGNKGSPASQSVGGHFSRCAYLPPFVTAGKLNEAFHAARQTADALKYQTPRKRISMEAALHTVIGASPPEREALVEFYELSRWLVCSLLGPRHESALSKIDTAFKSRLASTSLLDVLSPSKLMHLASELVALAKTLLAIPLDDAAATPPAAARPPASASARPQDASQLNSSPPGGRASSPVGGRTTAASLATRTPSNPPNAKVLPADSSGTASRVADRLRAVLDALKAALGGPEAGPLVGEVESLKFTSNGFFWDEVYARDRLSATLCGSSDASAGASRIPSRQGGPTAADSAARLRGLVMLCSTAKLDAEPRHPEVLRRLRWFIGSLFMDMPTAPPVAHALSFSTLTPFATEDLLYSARELAAKNEDGVSVLYFLKTVHPDEWRNFLERLGVRDESKLFLDRTLALELRLWASFRGQTLARTVEGMMCHERALRLQARWEGYHGEALEQLVRQKYAYVVSCQMYGTHKRNRDPKAADTEFLLQRFPNLRVAYVDKTSTLSKVPYPDGTSALRETIRFYSVLIKGSKEGGEEAVQQVYRVQLPGDMMLGEGKPENQNHAVIFTRGEALQAIDMNQCGYLEEALKMRNLLGEFRKTPGATIVGFREHIFTGQLSSLASYMALQEGTFVTLTQRVLSNPLHIRQHYGHPDVFDKIFALTTGGVSKASKGIHLSEDVYAGFNHTLRGGKVPYAEYVQVGKGRDVGMQQIYKFEAKLASGNAEQCLSRDVYRIAHRLDLARSFSFYYSGPGFYFNNAATVFAMFFFLYIRLLTHLLQIDYQVPVADLLNAQWAVQLGLLLTIPILCYLAVEHGIRHALVQMWRVNVSGSLLFFIFHMGTKAFYFDSTLKYGGAKYRPTGRGFVMRHEEFAELFRFYAGSHLYNGFELLWGLILLNNLGAWRDVGGQAAYWRTCWSLWSVAVAWLFSPFWFNPLAFDYDKNKLDLDSWLRWMQRKDAAITSSWETWWHEEHEYLATASWVKKMHIFLPAIRYALTFVGILAALSRHPLHEGAPFINELRNFALVTGGALIMMLLLLQMPTTLRGRPVMLRSISTALLMVIAIVVPYTVSTLSSFEVVHLFAAFAYLTAAVVKIPFAFGYTPAFTVAACKAYDYFTGGLLLGLCLLLSLSPGQVMKHAQNRALLSDAFNRGVQYAELSRLLIKD